MIFQNNSNSNVDNVWIWENRELGKDDTSNDKASFYFLFSLFYVNFLVEV